MRYSLGAVRPSASRQRLVIAPKRSIAVPLSKARAERELGSARKAVAGPRYHQSRRATRRLSGAAKAITRVAGLMDSRPRYRLASTARIVRKYAHFPRQGGQVLARTTPGQALNSRYGFCAGAGDCELGLRGLFGNLLADKLEGAPRFASNDNPAWGNRAFEQSIHDYYKAPPYWAGS